MTVRNHVIVSGIISGIWYYTFRTIPDTLVCFFSGFLIDADHFLDYYYSHPFTFNLKKISDACHQKNLKKIFVLLHSFELIFLMWLLITLLKADRVWLALAVGFTQHMIVDLVFNHPISLGYFLTYRILKGFRKESLVRCAKRRH